MDTPALPVAHSAVAEHGPYLLGLDSEGWVYVGLTIFFLIAILVAKAPKRITDALDQRIADTKRTMDEAKAIRFEAETMLAHARAQQATAATDAAAIMTAAQEEAAELIAKAEADAKMLVERRGRMAEDKIAAAERSAIADVRSRAAGAAAAAAAALIRDGHDAGADKALVDRTIAGLGTARLN